MNKKMIFTTIGIVVLAFIIFGIYNANGLKSIKIIKTITINGTPQEVFDMVKYLNNFPKWSPFLLQDSTQTYQVKGTDGTVGAQYHWEGNKGKDLGFQEIVKIEELRFIGMKCDIQKPFTAQPTFDYTFTQTSLGIEVKQVFSLQSGIVDAFFLWLFGAKHDMEKTNEQGLELLKKAIENI
ncbi:MAG: SRPBCC family protein [Bacteroidia bacterium]|jgi:hypothetical protein|nr:SRPBCC family protein [Bacteroidia bacterium]